MLQLPGRMAAPILDGMCFLNEISERFPNAISFAPGRPDDGLFRVADSLDLVGKHAPAILGDTQMTPEAALDRIAQYGRTNGIVHGHVAEQIWRDERLRIDPDTLVLTNGCQEAMLLVLLTLFSKEDVLLASEPVYQGITAAATLLGIEVQPVPIRPDGPDLDALARTLDALNVEGRQARAFYSIPDFDNPSGYSTSLPVREALVDLAARASFLLIEDQPYRMLRYDAKQLPLLKALAPEHVVLLGSYSKLIYPGLRLGYLTGDVPVRLGAQAIPLAEAAAKAKSLTSINTSPVMQAVLAAVLIDEDHSLRPRMARIASHYRARRDRLLNALNRSFADGPAHAAGVRWNRPNGGFFITMKTPFPMTLRDIATCAAEAGVITVPVSLFSFATPIDTAIRLSFSAVGIDRIDEGVDRLAGYLTARARS